MSDSTFEKFTRAYFDLMQEGLSRQPPSTQKIIAEALCNGGELFTLVRPAPLTISAMVTDGNTNVEVFRLTADETIN